MAPSWFDKEGSLNDKTNECSSRDLLRRDACVERGEEKASTALGEGFEMNEALLSTCGILLDLWILTDGRLSCTS